MNRTRCVIDTNILISAALSPKGLPNRLVEYFLAEHIVLISADTLGEFETRPVRPKIARYASPDRLRAFARLLRLNSVLVGITSEVADSLDPDDNMFLALALDGRADVIITGDKKHLLPLHPYRGILILTPRDYVSRAGLYLG